MFHLRTSKKPTQWYCHMTKFAHWYIYHPWFFHITFVKAWVRLNRLKLMKKIGRKRGDRCTRTWWFLGINDHSHWIPTLAHRQIPNRAFRRASSLKKDVAEGIRCARPSDRTQTAPRCSSIRSWRIFRVQFHIPCINQIRTSIPNEFYKANNPKAPLKAFSRRQNIPSSNGPRRPVLPWFHPAAQVPCSQ